MARRKKKQVAIQPPVEKLPAELPPNAYNPKTGLPYAKARLRDPIDSTKFYSSRREPWVTTGYDTWSMDEWRDKFKGQQPDGRYWEFFGDPIDIWEGYTNE